MKSCFVHLLCGFVGQYRLDIEVNLLKLKWLWCTVVLLSAVLRYVLLMIPYFLRDNTGLLWTSKVTPCGSIFCAVCEALQTQNIEDWRCRLRGHLAGEQEFAWGVFCPDGKYVAGRWFRKKWTKLNWTILIILTQKWQNFGVPRGSEQGHCHGVDWGGHVHSTFSQGCFWDWVVLECTDKL